MGQSVHSLGFRLGKSFGWSVLGFSHVASASLYGRFVYDMRLVFEYMEFFFWKYGRFFSKMGLIFYKIRLNNIQGNLFFFVDVYDVGCSRLLKSLYGILGWMYLSLGNKGFFFDLFVFRLISCGAAVKYFYIFFKRLLLRDILGFKRGWSFIYYCVFFFSLRLFLVKFKNEFLVFKNNIVRVNFKSFLLKRFFFFFSRGIIFKCMDLSFRFLNEFLNLKFRNFFGDGFVNFKFYFSSNAGLGFTDLSLISRYVVYKLYNRFSLYESARPFLYNLLRIPYVKGFFVVGNGRFTRKQRAFYIKHCVGKLSFSAVSAVLYYTFSKVKTKYGMCGVHLWVNYDSSFVNRVRVKLL